ncbi:AAA family ATPase [Thalassotalea sp. SU-HH00458]|uniref:AAA family ATPase n=1 Tax=Thalassotalea sp. SU-HH00458 TaxID=3127657 RepID=UPI00310B9E61
MNHTAERAIIAYLDHSFRNSSHQGIVQAVFEKINDEYYPINTKEHFCDTKMVFVTAGYDDLESRYTHELFELRVNETSKEMEDGKCRYVSTGQHASPIKSKLVTAQIIKNVVPDHNNMLITTSNKPISKLVFLENDDILSGPFEVVSVNIENESFNEYLVELSAVSQEQRSADQTKLLQSFHYSEIHLGLVHEKVTTIKLGANDFTVISDLKDALNHAEKLIDHISDHDLVTRYGGMLASNPNIRNFSKGQRDLIRKQVGTIREFRVHKPRFNKLFDLFDLADAWPHERKTLLDEFIESEKGKEILQAFIDDNKDEYFQEERARFEERLTQDMADLTESCNQLRQQKAAIETQVRQANEELKNSVNIDFQKEQAAEEASKLDSTLLEKRKQIDDANNDLNQIQEKFQQYSSLEEMENYRTDLSAAIKFANNDLEKLEEQKDNIQKQISDSNDELLHELVKLKPRVDMLSGVLKKEHKEHISFNTPANTKLESFDTTEQSQFIESVSEQLTDFGRKVDFEDLTNIITCVSQSQFTLFSGLPGTGKTSLAKLIGKAAGLDNRLLNIPVARGWTSQRDVLGFYNALSQSYVPSATGLYDLINQMQAQNDGDVNAPAIVLLDEFNLSQPEHYFSPFMEMADKESNRVIHTGDQDNPMLAVPEHIRFLGTINHDESVQSLTPRMLDRSAIVHFEEQIDGSAIIQSTSEKEAKVKQILSGNDFIRLFQPKANTALPDEVQNILNDIIKVLYDDNTKFGSQVIVSYRKIKAITNYYNVASSLMISDRLTALDYAVSQHIIPLLNGFGEEFGVRLQALQHILPDALTKTNSRLQRIINRGQLNLHTYGALL